MSLISVVNGWQCEKCLVVKNSTPEFWNDGCNCPAKPGAIETKVKTRLELDLELLDDGVI